MDSHRYSTQVERLEVVETGRRRRWSDNGKLRIVIERLQTPRAISSTARRHGISRSLPMRWQRSFRPEPTPPEIQRVGFAPVIVAAGAEPVIVCDSGKRADGDYRWQGSSGHRRYRRRCGRSVPSAAGSGAPMIPLAAG
ncbi:transposase [Bradyrhizobium sp. AUGA SZCCT0431]|nr:transposase [Bradyrhizobium sp. AUGA SZCCT0431]